MPITLLIEVPIVLSDASEPEGETSDLADPAIVHLVTQLRRSPRAERIVSKGLFVQAQV